MTIEEMVFLRRFFIENFSELVGDWTNCGVGCIFDLFAYFFRDIVVTRALVILRGE